MQTKNAIGTRQTTVLLDGDVTAVDFGHAYLYYAVRNDGESSIYVSTESSKCAAGENGVVCIPAGGSYTHYNGYSGSTAIYICGRGTVTVIAQDDGNSPFKSTAKGGGSGGTAGKSAYEVAVDNGFVGTEKEWLASLKGEKGDDGAQGVPGAKGDQGEQGVQGIQGIQGVKGDDGYPFLIYKEYTDISEFAESDFPEIGLMFMIKAEGADSFPVYRYTGEGSEPYSYVTDLTGGEGIKGEKGDKGDQGEQGVAGKNGKDGTTYTPVIGSVTAGTSASASVEIDKDTNTAKFNFVLPKGDKGDKGTNGLTPYIDPETNHWFIGDKDTGVSAVGKSIKSLTSDENKNIIVTFTDGTTQNIGKVTVDVQADFLTADGFGKLRYYNGHFQYLDETSSAWIDTSVTPENVYVMNMTPQPMQSISCKYDKTAGRLKLKFTEPNDTIVDSQAFCIVEKVIIRRKLGSAPTDENDGDFVTEIPRRDFGAYSNSWFVDEGIIPEIGNTYYYKAFPMSTTGFYSYSDLNVTSVECKEYVLYGFKIDQNESDPASMITYLSDCDNANYASAYMDYTTDTFNYGDWKDAWFIKDLKPCMLKYDGTVDYELDRNDYTKKADGTASDVANTAYEGNAMIGFPKVYWKLVNNGDDTANIYISDAKLDDDFHCWSHIDNNGNEIDYCYMPIYTGGLVNGKLRSLSGLAPMANQTRETEINYAKANNLTDDIIWYTEVYSDRMLINLLLLLIGKSTDTQAVFGTGNSYTDVVSNSGTMDIKGLFWGNQDYSSGIKAFGMEHLWGNTYRAVAGWVYNNGKQKLKLSYGQNDGSTINGYNLDGTGYISIANSTPSGTSGGCISKMLMSEQGIIPIVSNGSASTYYPDIFWFDGSVTAYALLGDSCMKYNNSGKISGAFACALSIQTSFKRYEMCASISCKPLAAT